MDLIELRKKLKESTQPTETTENITLIPPVSANEDVNDTDTDDTREFIPLVKEPPEIKKAPLKTKKVAKAINFPTNSILVASGSILLLSSIFMPIFDHIPPVITQKVVTVDHRVTHVKTEISSKKITKIMPFVGESTLIRYEKPAKPKIKIKTTPTQLLQPQQTTPVVTSPTKTVTSPPKTVKKQQKQAQSYCTGTAEFNGVTFNAKALTCAEVDKEMASWMAKEKEKLLSINVTKNKKNNHTFANSFSNKIVSEVYPAFKTILANYYQNNPANSTTSAYEYTANLKYGISAKAPDLTAEVVLFGNMSSNSYMNIYIECNNQVFNYLPNFEAYLADKYGNLTSYNDVGYFSSEISNLFPPVQPPYAPQTINANLIKLPH